ncbi:ATP-dependent RNA helicase DHX58-like isoform X2 [Branchiostoma floridae x Branchiostoma belcheri]
MPTTESETPAQPEKELLRVFWEKLVQYIRPAAVGRCCTTSLQEKDQEAVKRKEETTGTQAAAELLLEKLLKQDNPGWFPEFVEALRQTGSKHVAEDLCPTETTPPADSSPYRELLRILAPGLTENMMVRDLLPYLPCLPQEDKEQIEQMWKTSGNTRAADVLLEKIVRCDPQQWFKELVCALGSARDEKSLELLTGRRWTDQDPIDEDRLSTLFQGLAISPANEEVQAADASAMKAAMLDDPNLDEGYEEDMEDVRVRGSLAMGPEGSIPMRDYQLELAEDALQGRNIVICAPTNSGKTRVAVYICKDHLEKNPNGKVLVMVNKVHLVEQHFQKQFKPLLQKSFHGRLGTISGENYSSAEEEHISFKQLAEQKDIIILTAQILENHLSRTDQERVELSDFSLMIFDECHHTQKENVYNKIMGRFMLQKFDQPGRPRPQIVGLTASPGVGGARTHEKAVSHILQILANLDASKIKTAEKHEEELKKVVGQPKRKCEITNERLQDPFGDELKRMMQQIHGLIDAEGERRPPADFGTQMYEQWVVEMEKEGGMKSNRRVQTCAEHLRKYNDALVMNDTLRMSDAFQYLKEFYVKENDRRDVFDDTDEGLTQIFSGNVLRLEKLTKMSQYENPNLEALKNKLKQECEAKEGARGILYTKTRQSTRYLLDWIRNTPELNDLLRADQLTGTGTGSVSKNNHMTAIKQREVIRRFREGELNLLIATTVAEEGLDIKECNFVIRYGLVTNEIAMMQASGRARAEDSTYTLVAGGKSGAGQREENNMYKIQMMHRAIKYIQDMPADQYEQQIKKRQRAVCSELHHRNNPAIKARKQAAASGTFLHCKKCNQKACDAAELRLIEGAHHVHPDPEFLRTVGKADQADEDDEPRLQFQEWSSAGTVKCRRCEQDWGMLMLHKGMVLPCLSIKNFILRKQGLPARRPKKWKASGIAVAEFDYATDMETPEMDMDTSDDDL